jgi:adenylate cyclase
MDLKSRKVPFQNGRWILVILMLMFAIFLILIFYQYSGNVVFTGKDKSIAILPFVNENTNKEDEYFSDGITEEIISELNKVTDIQVISRGTVMGYKGSKKNIRQIAEELHVAAVLEGGAQKSGNSIRINSQLIDVRSGKAIWSKVFDEDIKDIFSIQVELAQSIAEQLHAQLTEDEKTKIASRPTKNLEAFDQYTNGRYFYFKRTDESLRKAIEYFHQAIRLDPTFSKAYSGLADCYSAQGYISYELPSKAFSKAEEAALKALQLDSTLAEPHNSLGYIKFYYYWDWVGAEQEFLKAIQLDPRYALAYDSYGYCLTSEERFPEARVAMEKALQLDPMSAQINTDMGFSLYYSRNYDQAIKYLKSALSLSPKAPSPHIWLGRAYQEKKMYKEAITEYELTLNGIKDWPVAYAAIGYIYGISSQKVEAEKMLTKLKDLAVSRYVTPYGVALIYAALDDRKKAFECLNQAYLDRSNWLVWLKLDPRWVKISDDKRYNALIVKIGLSRNSPPPLRQ